MKIYINLQSILIFISLFFVVACSKQESRTWIYLIDHTIYDRKDVQSELDKIIQELRKKKSDYNFFKSIRGTNILYMAVDDRGANPIVKCTSFPEVQGWKDKKIEQAIDSLKECFKKIKNSIASRPKETYKKTLYVEAISRALEEIPRLKSTSNKIIVVGDLAIVDEYCFLEAGDKSKKCSCSNMSKIEKVNAEIKKLKKTQKLSVELIQTNIPNEESCRETRKDIWQNKLIK